MSGAALSMPEDGAGRRPSRARAIFTLGFLTLVSSFNYLDRALLGLMLPQIKGEMHLSDTALGLVTGLAFVLFYSLLGIPIAALADRASRRNIIAAGFFFWSLMAAATGYVTNVWQLASARFLMGAGEACGIPPSNSMISDLFSTALRPTALAVFGTAVAISAIVFYPAAAWIGQTYGWRTTFHVAGLVGIVLAVIFFVAVREPARGGTDATRGAGAGEREGFGRTLRFLGGQRSYCFLLLATVFAGAQVFAEGAWNATFLVRVHHFSLAEVGVALGTVRGALSTVGILACGIATDRLGRRDPRWRLWAPATIGIVFVPAEALFLLSDSKPVWQAAFAVASFFAFGSQSAIFAAVLSVSRVRMRALATSLLILCSSLFSQALGPLAVGWGNDVLKPTLGDVAIRYSMLTVVFCIAASSTSLLIASFFYRDDAARAGAADGALPAG